MIRDIDKFVIISIPIKGLFILQDGLVYRIFSLLTKDKK